MVFAHSTNSLALIQLDQLDNAERVLQDALRVLRRTGEVVDESRIPLGFARVRLAQGRPVEALKLVRGVIDEKKKQGTPSTDIPRMMLSQCLYDMGEFEEADQELMRILELTA